MELVKRRDTVRFAMSHQTEVSDRQQSSMSTCILYFNFGLLSDYVQIRLVLVPAVVVRCTGVLSRSAFVCKKLEINIK